MADLGRLDRQIEDTKQRLRQLEEDRETVIAAAQDLHGLAEYLHTVTCKVNHTDGCGWFYENSSTYPGGTWNGWTHKRYLRQAHEVFVGAGLTKEEIDRALEVYEKIHTWKP